MKVEFEDALWTKVKQYAETVGYSSPEEFVQHAVEKQIDAAAAADDDLARAKRMRGIGYLDFGRDI